MVCTIVYGNVVDEGNATCITTDIGDSAVVVDLDIADVAVVDVDVAVDSGVATAVNVYTSSIAYLLIYLFFVESFILVFGGVFL